MALEVGVNSYVTEAEASAYFADRRFRDLEAWNTATVPDREAALVTATDHVDRNTFVGRRLDPDQALEFPRCYPVTDEDEPGLKCDPDIVPDVKKATYEEALAILAGKDPSLRARLQAEGVTSARLGSVAETFSGAGANRGAFASPAAADYMKPYLKGLVGLY
jgi:hypothetical protein